MAALANQQTMRIDADWVTVGSIRARCWVDGASIGSMVRKVWPSWAIFSGATSLASSRYTTPCSAFAVEEVQNFLCYQSVRRYRGDSPNNYQDIRKWSMMRRYVCKIFYVYRLLPFFVCLHGRTNRNKKKRERKRLSEELSTVYVVEARNDRHPTVAARQNAARWSKPSGVVANGVKIPWSSPMSDHINCHHHYRCSWYTYYMLVGCIMP